ncbi:lamin tail domain-containing protein, partial [Vicingaceae bacterium]|nr:lamin tail domain-containing protein [Vicingaceae bacterium]
MKKLLLICLVILSAQSIEAQTDIVITEIMYNTPSVDSAEFIEIYNNGPSSIDLTNYSFSTGVTYTFPSVSLNAGEYYVITLNAVDFNTIYGFAPDAEWTSGNLTNTSESITIVDDLGNMVDSVTYDDGGPIWPTGTDGQGASIILCDPNTDNNDGANWIASANDAGTTIGGTAIFASPGSANTCCTVLTGTNNTTICAEDSVTINGTVYYASNSTGTEVFSLASGCDSTVTVALNVLAPKTGVVNTSINSNDNIVINGTTYNASNLSGTEIFTNVGSNSCDSTVTITLSLIPDLVITEIMYNTPSVDSAEFIEIYNNGSSSIDLTNYSFSTGVTYTFPSIILNTGEYFVVTSDSIDFYSIYGYAPNVEWTSGSLLNSSEDITIIDPFGNTVDSVNYDDGGPNWPTGTDGQGASIILCDPNTDNNDGNNWNASTNDAGTTIGGVAIFASPGSANFCCIPLTSTDTQAACDSLIWIDGNTYYSNNTTAVYTLQNGDGCDSIITLDLTINNLDLTLTNASPTLTANQTGATYQWLDCDNGNAIIPTETDQAFTPSTDGNYAVEITIGNCVGTSTCENVSTVGINESKQNVTSIYPNPTNGIFTVELSTIENGARIEIYSVVGQQIINQKVTKNQTIIDLSNYDNGIYFVKTQDD